MRHYLKILILLCCCANVKAQQHNNIINFVFTADAHYGLTKLKFKGDTNVSAHIVNAEMIKQINKLPGITIPADNGVNSGNKVSRIQYFIQAGDVGNRMEPPYQSAAASWKQFKTDYLENTSLNAQFLLVPGNHDISNAIGYSKTMSPKTDPTVMKEMYNRMLKPKYLKTNSNYNYATDKINYSENIGGVHLMFINLWPDSAERIWMQKDLAKVAKNMPAIVFCHAPPISDPQFFTNPLPPHVMTAVNKFENLLTEFYKEGVTVSKNKGSTDIEQRGWVSFLQQHPNIKAYFHGHSNYNEFYIYHGPDNNVAINTFRVDSPMKGKYSAKDETKLSFQLISLDPAKKLLTVRECLWNTEPMNPKSNIVFGESKTISLQ